MKYIKTYEKLENYSIWIILGTVEEIINIVKFFGKENNKNVNNVIAALQYTYSKKMYDGYMGTFLMYDNLVEGFSYHMIEDEKDKEMVLEMYENHYTIKGELKIENGKLVLDTLIGDIKKYNL